MPNKFEQPKVLKEAEKIYSTDRRTVAIIQHLEYSINGKTYPKLVLSTYKVDGNGFPIAKPKALTFPIDFSNNLSKAIQSLVRQ